MKNLNTCKALFEVGLPLLNEALTVSIIDWDGSPELWITPCGYEDAPICGVSLGTFQFERKTLRGVVKNEIEGFHVWWVKYIPQTMDAQEDQDVIDIGIYEHECKAVSALMVWLFETILNQRLQEYYLGKAINR